MIKTQSCPRCLGAVLDHSVPDPDSPLCVNCGWRPKSIPEDVREQVRDHLGKSYSEERYMHGEIGRGKPPLSGWQRTQRRRELDEARTLNDNSPTA